MSWSESRSRARVARLMASVPTDTITVESFEQYLPRRELVLEARGKSIGAEQPIVELPYNAVVVTHGVHLYANLMDYGALLEESGRETEAGARRVLGFLHVHYTAIDRLLEAYEAQRVDHHGGRVHAVILTPLGPDREGDRVRKAVSLAAAIRRLVEEGSALYERRFSTRVRIGVDTGPALAVNGGKRAEPEPLFIGDAANIAARLAEGETDGVYLSPRAKLALNGAAAAAGEPWRVLDEASFVTSSVDDDRVGGRRLARRLEQAVADFRAVDAPRLGDASAQFAFHRHEPPLVSLDFLKLAPANSVRQEMSSVFGDIDGFTAYVHANMSGQRLREVVRDLHVIRGELAGVLRDFGGRKIRFIGDCIQGVLAVGDRVSTDHRRTIDHAVECAGGMRSSFELCQTLLTGTESLGLAIGVEHGFTPITRLGIRGERSVRCASSKAVTVSELEQRRCDGEQTALGEAAHAKASADVRHAFGARRILRGLDHAAAIAFVSALAAPAIARAAAEPMRAYGGE